MDILSYLMYLSTSITLLTIFIVIHTMLTPYKELTLIRQGQGAASLSLAGTLVGFSLTLGASAIYNQSLLIFASWAVLSMAVQLLGTLVVFKVVGNVTEKIQQNNMAVGGTIGLTGLSLGIINAGCLS